MARWLALDDDPLSATGGTQLDDIIDDPAALVAPAAADLVVVTTSQADPGTRDLPRDDDVRGRRANSAPISFASAPSLTFGARAWTPILRKLVRAAMGGSIGTTGGPAPASIQSTIQMAQDGSIPSFIATLLREGQVDRMTGAWVNELTANFPADEEGSIEATLMALYHDVDDTGSVVGLPAMTGGADQEDAYMLRDVVAYLGPGAGVQIDCLGGFGFTINNNLSDDFRTRFCAGKNVAEIVVDGETHRVWYPTRNQLRAQTVTGRLDFNDVRPDRELRRIVRHAEKLVVELVGPPLGTTPDADEMLRLIFYKQTPTGGGAEPLVREGDQQSSYEFTAYLDTTVGKDLEAVSVGTAALV